MVKKNSHVEKILKITNENINSVSLEIQKDKSLFELNINNVILYILYNFEDKKDMLAKLKVLDLQNKGMVYDFDNIEDEIMQIIYRLVHCKGESFFKKNVFMVLKKSKFSTKVSTWYFKNKDLSPELANLYLTELENILYHTCKIFNEKRKDYSEEFKEVDKTRKKKERENSCLDDDQGGEIFHSTGDIFYSGIKKKNFIGNKDDEDVLISIEDSDEIYKMNKILGKLFQHKIVVITKEDKQKIARILDIMEIIINENVISDSLHMKKILKLIDIDDVLYKKVNKVLKSLVINFGSDKHKIVYKIYLEALYKYKNIYRSINSFFVLLKGTIDFYDIFEAANENPISNLLFLDRSIIPFDLLFEYCNENNFRIEVFEPLLIHLAKIEHDCERLEILKNRIEDNYDDNLHREKILIALNDRITYLNLQKSNPNL